MALLVSGVAVEIREVSLANKPAELRAASAKATVPVLVTQSGAIDESLEVMRWALAISDPEDWLSADDSALVSACDGTFKRHLDGYKYGVPDNAETFAHRALATEFLQRLETRLCVTTNICRDEPGLSDISIMPFVRQFAGVDRAWFNALPLPAVQGWLAHHLATPLFAAAMVRLTPWNAVDASQTIFCSDR